MARTKKTKNETSNDAQKSSKNTKLTFSSVDERKNAIERKAFEVYKDRQGKGRGKISVRDEPANIHSPSRLVERNDEKEDWYEAEKSIDQTVFGQALTPRELYQALMVRFYSRTNMEELSDQELAKEYHLYSYEFQEDVRKVTTIEENHFDFRNVALLMEQTEIPFLTKRILILAETSLLSHGTEKYYNFHHKQTFADSYGYWDQDRYLTNCPSLDEMGDWLRHARPLVEAGEIFYYPKIRIEPGYQDHLFDAIIQSRKFVQSVSASQIRTKLIRSVVNINLPIIDNIDLADFSKITMDEHQHLEKFLILTEFVV
jgi:hypothetical protein